MESTFSQRLKAFMDEIGLNAVDFIREIGLTNPEKVYRVMRDPSAKLGFDTIESILKRWPRLNANWLIANNGQMYLEEKEENNFQQAQNPPGRFQKPEITTFVNHKNQIEKIEIIIRLNP